MKKAKDFVAKIFGVESHDLYVVVAGAVMMLVVLLLLCDVPEKISHAVRQYERDHATFEFFHGKNNEQNSKHGLVSFPANRAEADGDYVFALSRAVIIGPFAEFPENVTLNFEATSVSGTELELTSQRAEAIGPTYSDETKEYHLWYYKDSDGQIIGVRTERYWDGYYLCVKLYENTGLLVDNKVDEDACHVVWDRYKSEVRKPDGYEIFNFLYEDGELICEPME